MAPRSVLSLSQTHADFVAAYLTNGRNAKAAYLSAFPTCSSPKQAGMKGPRLLKQPHIVVALGQARSLRDQAIDQALARYAVDQDRLADELARAAFTDLRDVVDWGTEAGEDGKPRQYVRVRDAAAIHDKAHGAIIELHQDGKGALKVRLASKSEAIMNIAKLKGWIVDKVEGGGSTVQAVSFSVER